MMQWWQTLDPGMKALATVAVVFLVSVLVKQRRFPKTTSTVPDPSPTSSTVGISSTSWPEPTLPIASAAQLLAKTDTNNALNALRIASGLNDPTWDKFVQPVVNHLLELVQLLPASESHHHAEPGGLWVHSLETANNANRLRQGRLLPSGRDTEDVGRHRHRWTAGIIVAAIAHDVGKVVTDLRIRLYGPKHQGSAWNATASAMTTTGAMAYAVDFPPSSERSYDAHQKLGALLLQRITPPETMTWIGEDPELLKAMLAYLSAEASDDNEVANIVRRAEAESVRRNLLAGPRTRFASARTVPLVERLMTALRRMLAEGGALPLNRPGAVGYVFEGDIWFASQRLANDVRQYLGQHESTAGIPGEDKNDRLYDVWQEYGACRTNPETGGAIWGGRIELPEQSYELPGMLRFPLENLYPSPTVYPTDMAGRILPMGRNSASPVAPVSPTPMVTPAVTPVMALPTIDHPAAPEERQEDPGKDSGGDTTVVVATTKIPTSAEDFLPDEACASPVMPVSPPSLSAQPMTPAIKLPAKKPTKGKTADKAPTEAALRFMGWLQNGLADGSLPYNEPKAVVHFVRYGESETVMLLVSPAIFRMFAQGYPEIAQSQGESGDHLGMAIQRAFTSAGWHIRGPAGKNVFRYQVMRNGDKGGNLLNGFLVREPEQFVNPVPPANDRLIWWNDNPIKT